MHLLFADRLPEQTIDDLEARGHVCVMEPGLSADDLPARIAGFDGLVVRSTKVRRAVFEAADRLVLVIRAGAGTNTIDTDAAASQRGLRLQRPRPQRGRGRRAHHGAAAGDRPPDRRQRGGPPRRSLGQEALQQGRAGCSGRPWASSASARSASRSPSARRRSASSVQSLAKPGRSAYAVARAEELGITMCDSLEELVSSSDIVSLHVPSNADTQHLVDADFLARMKHGRDPAQHLARRRGRRGRPARGAGRGRGTGRAGRLRRRAGLRQGLVGLAARPAPERRRDPPHRRLDGAGAARHRGGRDRDRRRVHVRRGAPLRQPRPRPARVVSP